MNLQACRAEVACGRGTIALREWSLELRFPLFGAVRDKAWSEILLKVHDQNSEKQSQLWASRANSYKQLFRVSGRVGILKDFWFYKIECAGCDADNETEPVSPWNEQLRPWILEVKASDFSRSLSHLGRKDSGRNSDGERRATPQHGSGLPPLP